MVICPMPKTQGEVMLLHISKEVVRVTLTFTVIKALETMILRLQVKLKLTQMLKQKQWQQFA